MQLLLLSLLLLLPSSLSLYCNVVDDCGAPADNRTLATPALQACLHRCCPGGGPCTLFFPPNASFLVSSLDFSNTTGLQLLFGASAGLYATTNSSLYPIAPFFPPMGKTTCYQAVLFGRNVTDLLLSGPRSAVVDGNGWPWQPLRPTLPHQAPKLLEIVDGRNLTIQGMTLSNSANWHVHAVYSSHVRFHNLSVLGAREYGGTDGIDPHSCSDVEIAHCTIDVGDDGIAITSGTHDITGQLIPSSNTLVRDSNILSRNFAIGSSVLANVSDVTVQDCSIGDDHGSSPWAIKIKTHEPYGGVVRNITFQRLRLGLIAPNAYQQPNAGMAFTIYENYGSPTTGGARTSIEGVRFVNITAVGARWAANPLAGAASGGLRGLHFENVDLGRVTEAQPWLCMNVSGTVAQGVQPPLPSSCL